MFNTARSRFYFVEINLVLWLIALGSVLSLDVDRKLLWPVVAGFVFAAIGQHQAFYQRKREREVARSTSAQDAG